MPFDLTGRVALVTGSSQGVGGAIARCLSECGADIAINYVSESSLEKAEKVAEYVRGQGRKAAIFRADVSKEDEVKKLLSDVYDEFGRIDILSCNAGVNSDNDIFDLELPDWQRIIDVDLTGAFLCSKYVIDYMKKNNHGRIILTSSVCGEQGTLFGQVHYGAAKAGQRGFAMTLARSVAPYGITVNCVAPGTHPTETLQQILATSDPHRLDGAKNLSPFKRLGTCEDVGYAVCYLASDEANYVTGATIDVNGGIYMR